MQYQWGQRYRRRDVSRGLPDRCAQQRSDPSADQHLLATGLHRNFHPDHRAHRQLDPPSEETGAAMRIRGILSPHEWGLLVLLAVLFGFFSFYAEGFLDPWNLSDRCRHLVE